MTHRFTTNRKHFASWKDALDVVNPESLLGCTIEIWFLPHKLVYASDEAQESGREVFRCVIEQINAQANQPFKTIDWVKFDKQSGSWRPTQTRESLLEVTEDCLSGIHIANCVVVSVSPSLNTHLLFYRQKEQIPHNPGKSITSDELTALIKQLVQPGLN
jgi:hypothetical protein